MRILIYGAGGHARVIADIIACQADAELAAIVDDDPDITTFLGLEVLRANDLDEAIGRADGGVIAIGDNATRQRLGRELEARGCPAIACAHPRATIAVSVELAPGCVVMAGACINPGARIGRHAVVNTLAVVEHDCVVADAAFVGPHATLCGGVHVESLAMVGAGGTIIPGCRIGAGAIVGAGSVVIGDISPGATVVGNPARPIRVDHRP